MMYIEIIGLEPPCKKCNELLDNAKRAVAETGIEAEVVKKWTLSEEIRQKYGAAAQSSLGDRRGCRCPGQGI